MKQPAVLLAALAAAACNQQGNEGGRTPAADVTMRPGLWETTLRVIAVDSPSAPPEVLTAMRNAILATPPVVERSCLTAADAANPAIALRDKTARGQPGYSCELGESMFANGRIRMTLTCRSAQGQPEQRQAMVGSYTAETLQAAITGASATPATEMMQSIPVRVESTLTGRRVGECTGNETD